MYILQDMKAQVSKWGNSLGVRIPRAIADAAGVKHGDVLDVAVDGEAIVLRPAVRRYTLEELLDGLPEGMEPEKIDWGPPRGKEVW